MLKRSPEENRIRIAYHEAGHAVVADDRGLGIEEVSLGDEENGYTESILSLKDAILKLGDRVGRENVALKLVAGELVQCRQGYGVYGDECGEDRRHFISIVEELCRMDGKEYREHEERLRDHAAEIIDSQWQQIDAIANALLEHNVLSGADAISIIRRN